MENNSMIDILLILIMMLGLVPLWLEIRKTKPNAYWENIKKKNTMEQSKQDPDKI